MFDRPPIFLSRRTASCFAVAVLGLVYLWFWIVAAHRVHGAPYTGFASVFATGCGDFEHFYFAARAMREGGDPYDSGVRGYIYPPLIAFLFMPLTLMSVQAAATLMLVVNLAMALLCTVIVSREVIRRLEIEGSFDTLIAVVALTALLSATRLRGELQMWQTNVPMMAAVLLALRWLDSRPWLAGVLLGLAFNIKYLPLVFLPYLLVRRRFESAAWFLVGIVGFALLPALYSGWGVNLHHWAEAASGLAGLLGVATSTLQRANVDPITIGHSISITSGFARVLGAGAAAATWLASAAVALASALVFWAIYRQMKMPVLAWPRATAQQSQPYLGMVVIEWVALLGFALALSPQTNPRHTSLLLMVFALLAALLLFPAHGVSRRAAFAALAILLLGFALPPRTPEFTEYLAWWGNVGGAGWSMLLMLPFLLVAGFNQLNARGARHRPPGAPRP